MDLLMDLLILLTDLLTDLMDLLMDLLMNLLMDLLMDLLMNFVDGLRNRQKDDFHFILSLVICPCLIDSPFFFLSFFLV